ncbi:hypothetical protein JOB18_006889 [Solea senegalensis]|uniref:Uncharacterized protein n=1 Tax=Solea senegalensis TaxID=28829 RepID=A0AAV6T3X2_SOLSE|nr:hypothetical protein JOB18_006889 [Solea senegalensis]
MIRVVSLYKLMGVIQKKTSKPELQLTMDVKVLFLHFSLILGTTSTTSLADPSGNCKVIWLFGAKCSNVSEKLISQIKDWPDVYELKSSSSLMIEATHTSPTTQSVNKLHFLLGQKDLCKVIGEAALKRSGDPADTGSNYCSMQNLMRGSGLVNDRRYKQITNRSMCSGCDTAHCTMSL